MILTYRDKRTRDFAAGKRIKAFDGIKYKAEMKLDQLDAATSLLDLDLPGNRLEALKGDRKGQYSIRINDQWRVDRESAHLNSTPPLISSPAFFFTKKNKLSEPGRKNSIFRRHSLNVDMIAV